MPEIFTQAGSLGTGNSLRIAVVSDLHAFDRTLLASGAPSPSFLEIGAPDDPSTQHPVASLLTLIRQKSLSADLLLCPGDLGDKCHPAATKQAWETVHRIGTVLGAKSVVATAGNHDVDSRLKYTDHDARGFLQSLRPGFPHMDENVCDRYWSRHFAVLCWTDLRLLILNSSAYHGANPSNGVPEYEHGRIAPRTIESIRTALAAGSSQHLNLLLCHHHPQPVEEYGLGATDIMQGGADLLQLLSSGDFGEWLLIHGHKHYPKLCYAQGATATTPVVFAAGSLCACLPPQIQAVARNQFYLLDFPLDVFPSLGLVGRFQAWDWNYGIGWLPAQERSGLPHQGGFGIRDKPDMLAHEIAKECTKRRQTKWTDVEQRLTKVRYVLPNDLRLIKKRLERDGRFQILDRDGRFEQVEHCK